MLDVCGSPMTSGVPVELKTKAGIGREKVRFTSSCGHQSDMFFIVSLYLPEYVSICI